LVVIRRGRAAPRPALNVRPPNAVLQTAGSTCAVDRWSRRRPSVKMSSGFPTCTASEGADQSGVTHELR
jgi:hypothetical protein